jgi:hypothetical protein
MRFRAPARGTVDAAMFDAPIFAGFASWRDWLLAADWPSLDRLNAELAQVTRQQDLPPYRFVTQTPALLADGLHYESRIAMLQQIACRPQNWHDLFNALVWLSCPAIKQALNQRQMRDIARHGPRDRSRGQYALTHFDESGVVVVLRDPAQLAAWDRHDWPRLFLGLEAEDFAIAIVGHALLEQALEPGRLLCGRALVALHPRPLQALPRLLQQIAEAIGNETLLCDPLELRPLPLMGLPGWHPRSSEAAFLREGECFQPLRAGRYYPAALLGEQP